jgi:hypothetical protein
VLSIALKVYSTGSLEAGTLVCPALLCIAQAFGNCAHHDTSVWLQAVQASCILQLLQHCLHFFFVCRKVCALQPIHQALKTDSAAAASVAWSSIPACLAWGPELAAAAAAAVAGTAAAGTCAYLAGLVQWHGGAVDAGLVGKVATG